MVRGTLVLLAVAVGIGALMPSTPSSPVRDAPDRPLMVQDAAKPPPAQRSGGGMVNLSRQVDGHFYADVRVNGSDINFMVDTGASVVALTVADAERAGIHVDEGEFDVVAEGASGPVMGVPVMLREVTLGDRTVTNVQGVVLADSRMSLLGQNFLSQFDNVSIEKDEMVLR